MINLSSTNNPSQYVSVLLISFQHAVLAMIEAHPAEPILQEHYASPGIRDSINSGLRELGKTVEMVELGDLKMLEQFHMGGDRATLHFLSSMDLNESDAVLDVGCGVGGPCRTIASTFRVASIDGIDLTPEYVELGNEINSWPLVKASFLNGVCPKLIPGSALSMPYADRSFTKVVMMHVGMNIQNKTRLFQELWRVLQPGGKVGVFDVMRLKDVELKFPMPWSSKPETSFVHSPADYLSSMEAAGFVATKLDNRREALIEQLSKQVSAMHGATKNPLQVGILMGEAAPQKGANAMSCVRECIIGPVELICSKL